MNAFVRQDSAQRSRWARTGTSLPTARRLDGIADDVLVRCLGSVDLSAIEPSLAAIIGDGTLEELLDLDENQKRGFKPYRSAPRTALISVDMPSLVLDWVAGLELHDIAERHLADIKDEEYRYEQLAEFSAQVLEHHLPWTIGIIMDWVNERLDALDEERRLPAQLPAAIHYGVRTPEALSLMGRGVRSRRLANVVASIAPASPDDTEEHLRRWLNTMTVTEWTKQFAASPTETADLLSYVRARRRNVLTTLFDGASVELNVDLATLFAGDEASVHVARHSDHPAAPIELRLASGDLVGTVSPADHNDAELILATGIPVDLVSATSGDQTVVRITLAPR